MPTTNLKPKSKKWLLAAIVVTGIGILLVREISYRVTGSLNGPWWERAIRAGMIVGACVSWRTTVRRGLGFVVGLVALFGVMEIIKVYFGETVMWAGLGVFVGAVLVYRYFF